MDIKAKFRVSLAISALIVVSLMVFSGRVASGDDTALPGFIISFFAFGIAAPVTVYYNQRRQGNHATFREVQFLENITDSLRKEAHLDETEDSKN